MSLHMGLPSHPILVLIGTYIFHIAWSTCLIPGKKVPQREITQLINNAIAKKSKDGGRPFYEVQGDEHQFVKEVASRRKETIDEQKVTGIILEEAMTSICVVGCIA